MGAPTALLAEDTEFLLRAEREPGVPIECLEPHMVMGHGVCAEQLKHVGRAPGKLCGCGEGAPGTSQNNAAKVGFTSQRACA